MNYMRCIHNRGNEASLTIGTIYRSLPTTRTENESGMLRIIDNEGEDYRYSHRWFEQVDEEELVADLVEPVMVRLNQKAKIAIRDMAHAQGVSMASLVREWIDERLDLPEPA